MTTYTTTRVTQGRGFRRRAGLAGAAIVALALGVGVTQLTTGDPAQPQAASPVAPTADTINGSDVHLYNQAEEIEFDRRCEQARP